MVDKADRFHPCPVYLSHGPIAQHPPGVDEVGCGVYPNPQELSNLILLVQENREFTRIYFQEFTNRFAAFFYVYAEKDQASGLVLVV